MLVSFCVIAYNEERTLSSLFADIISQDYPHEKMEIVLVNAMSTDATKRLMNEFAEQENGFQRVAILDNDKIIQAAGWNIAIKEAKGDIILRIDAHTMIPKDFVSKNVACIKSGEYVSGGQRPSIIDEATPWKYTLLLAESSMFGSSIAPYRKGQKKTYVKSVFHGAYRREVFEKAGYFNENLGRTEDNEMHYRITKAGYKIHYSPEIISYQYTRNTWLKMIKQKYGNGYWIGLTLGVCPKCFSIYHFVPFAFVLAIMVVLFCWCLGMPTPMFLLGGTYLVLNLLMTFMAMHKEKRRWQHFLLPIIFFSLHVSYGTGTLVGILKMPYWKYTIRKGEKNEKV